MAKKPPSLKTVETLKHDEAKRKNIPTAEHQSVLKPDDAKPQTLKYPRNTDLDPQLVWRGKGEQDWSNLVGHASLYGVARPGSLRKRAPANPRALVKSTT